MEGSGVKTSSRKRPACVSGIWTCRHSSKQYFFTPGTRRTMSSNPDCPKAERVGTVVPQRPPTAGPALAAPPPPGAGGGGCSAWGYLFPAMTRFGFTSVRPKALRSSSRSPSRTIARMAPASYAAQGRRMTRGSLAGFMATLRGGARFA